MATLPGPLAMCDDHNIHGTGARKQFFTSVRSKIDQLMYGRI